MSTQTHRPRALIAGALVLAACIGLAACGSSSSSPSTSANAAATAAATTSAVVPPAGPSGANGVPPAGPSGATGRFGRFAARFTALRECLQKNGVTLPHPTPGQGPTGHVGGPNGGGFFGARGARGGLPSGVSRTQMEAALKKCGGAGAGLHRFGAGGYPGGGFAGRLHNPTYTADLAKFATCMRENGVDVPAPNTSGNGPIFNTKGLNPTSPTFTAAETKCRPDLRQTFQPGAAGAPGAP
jgi:hypothetical protein